MKKNFTSLSWLVAHHDVNTDKIEYYDILKYQQDFIKQLKKKCADKNEFSSQMRNWCMRHFWSKAEWELIVKIDENGRIWLNPWCGSREPQKSRMDVTDRTDFDWKGFATLHGGKQIYKNCAKIDVFSQLEYIWDDFITYLWTTRTKWERDDPKYH